MGGLTRLAGCSGNKLARAAPTSRRTPSRVAFWFADSYCSYRHCRLSMLIMLSMTFELHEGHIDKALTTAFKLRTEKDAIPVVEWLEAALASGGTPKLARQRITRCLLVGWLASAAPIGGTLQAPPVRAAWRDGYLNPPEMTGQTRGLLQHNLTKITRPKPRHPNSPQNWLDPTVIIAPDSSGPVPGIHGIKHRACNCLPGPSLESVVHAGAGRTPGARLGDQGIRCGNTEAVQQVIFDTPEEHTARGKHADTCWGSSVSRICRR